MISLAYRKSGRKERERSLPVAIDADSLIAEKWKEALDSISRFDAVASR